MGHVIDSLKKEFCGKKVLIVGLGLQGGGSGMVRFFFELGAQVTVTDLKSQTQLAPTLKTLEDIPVTYRLGQHNLEDFLGADLIFKGPSVPWDLPELKAAGEKGVPIEMEASFFMSYCSAPVIGITGTRGKSTTASMIYSLLSISGKKTYLAGNIPQISTINLLKEVTPDDYVVLELSSWQLSGFHRKKISPPVAVITNLYPDHQNYYSNMQEYWYDKTAIYRYQDQKGLLVVNKNLSHLIPPDRPKGRISYFTGGDFPLPLLYLKGEHNLENAACALSVARKIKLTDDMVVPILSRFKALPFRLEIVGEKDKIFFVNDTTATTPTATDKAIQAFFKDPIVLLLGGNSKNLPTDQLLKTLSGVAKIILLPGTFTDEIRNYLETNLKDKLVPSTMSFSDAVYGAYQEAQKIKTSVQLQKVIVLLSPAATSFAQFRNEFDRGLKFNEIVKTIINLPYEPQK